MKLPTLDTPKNYVISESQMRTKNILLIIAIILGFLLSIFLPALSFYIVIGLIIKDIVDIINPNLFHITYGKGINWDHKFLSLIAFIMCLSIYLGVNISYPVDLLISPFPTKIELYYGLWILWIVDFVLDIVGDSLQKFRGRR